MKFKKTLITIPALLVLFFSLRTFLPGGAIYLEHNSENNSHVVTVNAKDLKHPFFGIAFHLKYDTEKYTYDHFGLGDFFTSDNSPLVLVNEKNGIIIVGISLKRGEQIAKPEGTLLSLYFNKKSPYGHTENTAHDFTFENTVYSTFNKERSDIENVIFKSN